MLSQNIGLRRRLSKKVCVVTGSGTGIGRATALRLASEGASLVLNVVRSIDAANNVASEIRALGSRAFVVKADVSEWDQVNLLINKANQEYGGVDILINNAGIHMTGPVVELAVESWRRLIDVDLTGAFLCCKAVLPHMIKQRYGKIVNISSVAGIRGQSDVSAYCAAKFGLIGLTQSLARHL